MSPIEANFVPFPPKTGTNMLHVNNCAMSEWVHAAGLWYNSTLMSCEGKVAVEFVGWT